MQLQTLTCLSSNRNADLRVRQRYGFDSLTRGEARMSVLSGVIWSRRTLPTLSLSPTTRAIFQTGREGRTDTGKSGGSDCQGLGSLAPLFDLARWREHHRHQESSSMFYYGTIIAISSTPHNKNVKKIILKICWFWGQACAVQHHGHISVKVCQNRNLVLCLGHVCDACSSTPSHLLHFLRIYIWHYTCLHNIH